MPAERLEIVRVHKPWGRHRLWPGFDDAGPDEEPIGEIWFPGAAGDDPEVLIKYLFTSERLSVQVHPDDAMARAQGHKRGKDEAWLVLAAEPNATIAMGPKRRLSKDELRMAALDGSIVDLLDWRPVKAGDFIYSPAGTIHALGAGLTVIEVQQNLDLTYRLYDYGRPRKLHLDEAVAAATLEPFVDPLPLARRKFAVEMIAGTRELALEQRTGWLVPITGTGAIEGRRLSAGECWTVTGAASLTLDDGATALLAYSDGDGVSD
jgi:mannose-6-phosphate isomerase